MDKSSNSQEKRENNKFQMGLCLVWSSLTPTELGRDGIKLSKCLYKNLVRTAVEWRHLAAFCLPTASVNQEIWIWREVIDTNFFRRKQTSPPLPRGSIELGWREDYAYYLYFLFFSASLP